MRVVVPVGAWCIPVGVCACLWGWLPQVPAGEFQEVPKLYARLLQCLYILLAGKGHTDKSRSQQAVMVCVGGGRGEPEGTLQGLESMLGGGGVEPPALSHCVICI